MNRATKRGTKMLAGLAGLHGHRLGRFKHGQATVKTKLAHSRCQHGCGAEGYVYTRTIKGKSQVTGVASWGIRKGCVS